MHSIQEQEHWDHVQGSASEHQNCFAESMMELHHWNANASHFGEGEITVTVSHHAYCPVTDGFLGMRIAGVYHFQHRDDAYRFIESKVDPDDGETEYRIDDPAEKEWADNLFVEPIHPKRDIFDDPSEDMDGDHASALASAGFGTDEDYEHGTPMGEE